MNLLIALLLNATALLITSKIVPGFMVESFTTAVLAAIILGVINTFIKPVLVILTAPINLLTLGLFTFVINAIVLWLVMLIVPGVESTGWLATILAAIVLSVVSTILSMVLNNVAKRK